MLGIFNYILNHIPKVPIHSNQVLLSKCKNNSEEKEKAILGCMGRGNAEMSTFQVSSARAVYGNCQKVSSQSTLSENSSTWRLLKLTERRNELSSLRFMNPEIYTWCSFERWHSQACFCFLWLCRVWKLRLFNSMLMYLNGLKRANQRKDIEKSTRNWHWIEWASLPPNEKVNTFLEDQPERSHG